jgi:hypothetical protein
LITEFGLGRSLDNASSEYVMYELGGMYNRSAWTAWGATASARLGDEAEIGIHGRFRRWLTETWALDISPGFYDLDPLTFNGRVGLSWGDYLGVTAGMDLVHAKDGDSEIEWYSDIRFGSYSGVGVGLVFAVLVAVSVINADLAGPF